MYSARNASRPRALLLISALALTAAMMEANADDGIKLYASPSIRLMSPDAKFGVNNSGPALSLGVGAEVESWLDVQAGVGYGRATGGGNTYSQTTAGVDGLFMFSRDELRPFILVGVGAENERVNNPLVTGSNTSPNLSLGAGVQYSLDDRLSVQGDVRRVVGFQRDKAVINFARSYTTYVSVGLNYALDEPVRPMPVAAPKPIAPPPPPPPVPVAPPPPPPPPPPAPLISPPPPPAPVTPPAPVMEKVTLASTDLFDLNKATLKKASPQLEQIAKTLTLHPEISSVVVTGYTDRLGKPAHNLELSQQRADNVKAFLVSHGVAPARIRAIGMGSANPVSSCPKMSRAKAIKCLEADRRVEIEPIMIERPAN